MATTDMKGALNNAYEIDEVANNDVPGDEVQNNNFEMENNACDHEHKKKRHRIRRKFQKKAIAGLKILIHIVVGIYFAYATYHYIDIGNNACDVPSPNAPCGIQFCNGYGFLVLLCAFVYFGLFYYFIFKPKVGKNIHREYIYPFGKWWKRFSRTRIVSGIMTITLLILLAIFLYFETKDDRGRLRSLVAPCVFILAGYVFSSNRSAINWRTVVTGISAQFILGVICLRWKVGRQIFECFGQKVSAFLSFSDSGSRFVYGDTIIDDRVFAFAVLPVIYFFSFFISILYYWGTMQWIVIKLGWVLQQTLGTTVCESVIAASNIFLGMSESPLLIKPYLKKLTASEMHSIMVSGFATVSGTVLAAYLSFGATAAHLITSSVMAAPASLAFSKLYLPETEESKTTSKNIELEKSEHSSVLDAAASGANSATPIVLGIIANIVAFVSFITFLNTIVGWLGYLIGYDDVDFEWLFSKLFIPLAWAMGVPMKDADIVAKIVATKTIINEFVAYERLGEYIKAGDLDPRSVGITTFAICGFANPSSMGILIASLCALAPSRKNIITSVAFRALIVGSIVCFVSASIAGILVQVEEESQVHSRLLNALPRKNISIGIY